MGMRVVDHELGIRGALAAAALTAHRAGHPQADARQRLVLLDATAQWVFLAEDCRLHRVLDEREVRQRLLATDLEVGRAGFLAPPAQESTLLELLYGTA